MKDRKPLVTANVIVKDFRKTCQDNALKFAEKSSQNREMEVLFSCYYQYLQPISVNEIGHFKVQIDEAQCN